MEIEKNSDVLKLEQVFTYRGITVFIRRWYQCYEVVFAFGGLVYNHYIEAMPTKKKYDRQTLKEEIVHRLTSIATRDIDNLINQRSITFKAKQTYVKIRKLGRQWLDCIKPQVQPNADDAQVSIQKNGGDGSER